MDTKDIFHQARTESRPDTPSTDKPFVAAWLKELEQADKREKKFRRKGQELVKLFEADEDGIPYNILYSNTDTLLPALYNATPRPKVTGRFQRKEDALQRLAAQVSERLLRYLMDTNAMGYEAFDGVMSQCVLEALVPGRGVLRVKYEATFSQPEVETPPEGETPEELDPEDPQDELAVPETVTYETACVETVPWDRFRHGYGRKWAEVPWIAFEHQMTRAELEKEFPTTGQFVKVEEMGEDAEGETESISLFGSRTKESSGAKLATVYEVWDKTAKEVFFISPGAPTFVLKRESDPLGLSGFFPIPCPLLMIPKISGLCPVPLYAQYEQQAEELNDITTRITKITQALRVRGFYDSTLEDMEKVLKAEDNVLVPIGNAAALTSQNQSLDKAIWLFPLETLVGTLQQLYTQRMQVKTVIFEITGIADIMRGSSQASETLGAQELKHQWGTLRLKKAQKAVAMLARDTLRLMLEVAISHFDPLTIRAMTGLPFPTGEEKTQAQMQLQAMQMSGMQPDPQMLAVAQSPSWDDILGLLKDDQLRQFSVDIETNSTVDAEATDDKKDMAELMNALAQFLNGVTPLVQEGSLPFDAAKALLQNLLQRFRMGGEVEEALMSMQQPQGQGIDPKAQAEFQAAQEKLAQDQQAFQQEVQNHQLTKAQTEQEFQLERKMFAMEMQMERKALALEKTFAIKEIELQKTSAEQSLQHAGETQRLNLNKAAMKAANSVNSKSQQPRGGN